MLVGAVVATWQVNRGNEQAHAERVVARAAAAASCVEAIMAGGEDFDRAAAAIGDLGRVVQVKPKDTKAVNAAATNVRSVQTRAAEPLTKCRASVDAPPVCVVAATALQDALSGQRAQAETLKQLATAVGKKDTPKVAQGLDRLRDQEEQTARAAADVVNADCARAAGYRPAGG